MGSGAPATLRYAAVSTDQFWEGRPKWCGGRGEAHWGASLEAAYPGNPSITQTFPEFNLFPERT